VNVYSKENRMRIIMLHGTSGPAAREPRVIDVTPHASPRQRWWKTAKAASAVLLALVVFPILWIVAGLAMLAVAGLGAVAVVVLWLRSQRRGTIAAVDNSRSATGR
jgi:hypothetical protein